MKNSLAVVILNYNGRELLEKFLPSVVSFSKEAKIYVADNASTDDSLNFLEQHYPQIQLIQNAFNGGFAQGYNMALQNVNEDILCMLNNDIEVTENWLPAVLEIFETRPDIAVIQPKIKSYKQKNHFEYAGAAGGFIDKYGYPFCRGRIFDHLEEDTGQYDNEQEIFWASGACFFIRNHTFKQHGGFDELFFAHMEEIDLCWRIFNTGSKIYFTHRSIVYHVGGATLKTTSPNKTFLNFRNSLFTLLKNVPEESRRKIIRIRKLLDILAMLKFVAEFKFDHAKAIYKAHKSYSELKGSALKSAGQTVKSKNYYLIPSILCDYYVQRRKAYRNLI